MAVLGLVFLDMFFISNVLKNRPSYRFMHFKIAVLN